MRDRGRPDGDTVIAEAENKAEAFTKYTSGVDSNDPSILKKPITPSSAPAQFEASASTRRVGLNDGDSTHEVIVGTGLTRA